MLKRLLAKKYKMKDLEEVKTIISWQITRETAARTMKIDQLIFIRDLVSKKGLTEYNTNVIPIKAKSAIEMTKSGDSEETKL